MSPMPPHAFRSLRPRARARLAVLASLAGLAACADDPVGPGEAAPAAELVFSRGPVRSPSGEWPSGIHRMRASGGEPTPFVPAEGRDVAPLPSPDGRWVAFARSTCCGAGTGGAGVVMIAPAAGGAARLLMPERAFPVAWSADGRWLYVDASPGLVAHGIYRVDPASGSRERVAEGEIGGFFSPSPDGQRFVLVKGDYHVALTLHTGTLGGGALTPLAPDLGPLLYDPQWSPDGSRIAFLVRAGADVAGLYTVRPDGTDRRHLVKGNVVTGMRWSPDGASLALTLWDTTTTPWQADVYRMAADGSGLTQLTRTTESESEVAWSPDGRWLAFLGADATQQQNDVYRMRADGTQRERLTDTPSLNEGPPRWLTPGP